MRSGATQRNWAKRIAHQFACGFEQLLDFCAGRFIPRMAGVAHLGDQRRQREPAMQQIVLSKTIAKNMEPEHKHVIGVANSPGRKRDVPLVPPSRHREQRSHPTASALHLTHLASTTQESKELESKAFTQALPASCVTSLSVFEAASLDVTLWSSKSLPFFFLPLFAKNLGGCDSCINCWLDLRQQPSQKRWHFSGSRTRQPARGSQGTQSSETQATYEGSNSLTSACTSTSRFAAAAG